MPRTMLFCLSYLDNSLLLLLLLFFFFFYISKQEGEWEIRISDLHFMKRSSQPIELPLEDKQLHTNNVFYVFYNIINFSLHLYT
jgi:hypothetical protein